MVKGDFVVVLFLVMILAGCMNPTPKPNEGSTDQSSAISGPGDQEPGTKSFEVAITIGPADVPDLVSELNPNCVYIQWTDRVDITQGNITVHWTPSPSTRGDLRLTLKNGAGASERFVRTGGSPLSIHIPEETGVLRPEQDWISAWIDYELADGSVAVRQDATMRIEVDYFSAGQPDVDDIDSCGKPPVGE